MDNEHFPHMGADKELYWRDLWFFNYHINHDKIAWFFNSFEIAQAHRHEDDFTYWDEDHYYVGYQAGSGGEVYVTAMPWIPCGNLWIETDDAEDSFIEVSTQCVWEHQNGFPLLFEIRLYPADYEFNDFYAGFVDLPRYEDGTWEGAYFLKPAGSVRLYFVVEDNDVETRIDTGYDIGDLLYNEFLRLCAHWDGAGNWRWFIVNDSDGTIRAQGVVTAGFDVPNMWYFGFGCQTSTDDETFLLVDYIKVAQKRDPSMFGWW
jgi:hypothetical protein